MDDIVKHSEGIDYAKAFAELGCIKEPGLITASIISDLKNFIVDLSKKDALSILYFRFDKDGNIVFLESSISSNSMLSYNNSIQFSKEKGLNKVKIIFENGGNTTTYDISYNDDFDILKIVRGGVQWGSSSGSASRRSREGVGLLDNELHNNSQEISDPNNFVSFKDIFISLGSIANEETFRETDLLKQLNKLISNLRKNSLLDKSFKFGVDKDGNIIHGGDESNYNYFISSDIDGESKKLRLFGDTGTDEFTYNINISLNSGKVVKVEREWFHCRALTVFCGTSKDGYKERTTLYLSDFIELPNEILYHDEKKETLELERFVDVKKLFLSLDRIDNEEEFRKTDLLEQLNKLIAEFRRFPLIDHILKFDIDKDGNIVYGDENSNYKFTLKGELINSDVKLTIFFENSDDEYTYVIVLNGSGSIVSLRRDIFLVDIVEQIGTDILKTGGGSNVLLYQSKPDIILKQSSNAVLLALTTFGSMFSSLFKKQK